MNTRKIISASFGLLLTGIVGCGQGFSPSPDQHIAGPQGGGDVFNGGTDNTNYKTASFEVLNSTLVDVMGVADVTPGAECPVGIAGTGCPKYQPIAFLNANKGALGAAVYNQADPLSTQAPGSMTSGGFKAWVLASSSASGLMMAQAQPALFPNGVNSYDYLYQALLGRAPTAAEVSRLDQLEADIATANPGLATSMLSKRQGAAVASSVLGSMEFLMVN